MYSDGVTEVQFHEEFPVFEEKHLLQYLHSHGYDESQQTINSLLANVRTRGETDDLPDDVTIFLLTRS
jgi:serine phosphatase RsbU (regulator of sigma subunit)